MRRIRFIAAQPHEVLGAVRQQGDVLEIDDDEIAADLLRRSELFEDVDRLPETSVAPEEV